MVQSRGSQRATESSHNCPSKIIAMMATLAHRALEGVRFSWRKVTGNRRLWLRSIRRLQQNNMIRSVLPHHPRKEFSIVVTGICARAYNDKMCLSFKHINLLFPCNLRTQGFFWWVSATLLHGLASVWIKYNHLFYLYSTNCINTYIERRMWLVVESSWLPAFQFSCLFF